ncbi:MAG: BrnT family toxin [Anaerolineae bacterium]
MLNITGYIWREDVVDKLAWKHQIQVEEVVQVFQNNPRVERLERGHRPGEDLYVALGQTDTGRYLTIFFILKKGGRALINTARDMTRKERRRYGKR